MTTSTMGAIPGPTFGADVAAVAMRRVISRGPDADRSSTWNRSLAGAAASDVQLALSSGEATETVLGRRRAIRTSGLMIVKTTRLSQSDSALRVAAHVSTLTVLATSRGGP